MSAIEQRVGLVEQELAQLRTLVVGADPEYPGRRPAMPMCREMECPDSEMDPATSYSIETDPNEGQWRLYDCLLRPEYEFLSGTDKILAWDATDEKLRYVDVDYTSDVENWGAKGMTDPMPEPPTDYEPPDTTPVKVIPHAHRWLHCQIDDDTLNIGAGWWTRNDYETHWVGADVSLIPGHPDGLNFVVAELDSTLYNPALRPTDDVLVSIMDVTTYNNLLDRDNKYVILGHCTVINNDEITEYRQVVFCDIDDAHDIPDGNGIDADRQTLERNPDETAHFDELQLFNIGNCVKAGKAMAWFEADGSYPPKGYLDFAYVDSQYADTVHLSLEIYTPGPDELLGLFGFKTALDWQAAYCDLDADTRTLIWQYPVMYNYQPRDEGDGAETLTGMAMDLQSYSTGDDVTMVLSFTKSDFEISTGTLNCATKMGGSVTLSTDIDWPNVTPPEDIFPHNYLVWTTYRDERVPAEGNDDHGYRHPTLGGTHNGVARGGTGNFFYAQSIGASEYLGSAASPKEMIQLGTEAAPTGHLYDPDNAEVTVDWLDNELRGTTKGYWQVASDTVFKVLNATDASANNSAGGALQVGDASTGGGIWITGSSWLNDAYVDDVYFCEGLGALGTVAKWDVSVSSGTLEFIDTGGPTTEMSLDTSGNLKLNGNIFFDVSDPIIQLQYAAGSPNTFTIYDDGQDQNMVVFSGTDGVDNVRVDIQNATTNGAALLVNSTQILSTQQAHVADAVTSHSMTDAGETCNRSQVGGYLDALGTVVNLILSRMETHGLLKTS